MEWIDVAIMRTAYNIIPSHKSYPSFSFSFTMGLQPSLPSSLLPFQCSQKNPRYLNLNQVPILIFPPVLKSWVQRSIISIAPLRLLDLHCIGSAVFVVALLGAGSYGPKSKCGYSLD